MSTNFAKTVVWNHYMTSNCDVTKSEHQIQITAPLCHWMKPPIKIFCVRHCSQGPCSPKFLEDMVIFNCGGAIPHKIEIRLISNILPPKFLSWLVATLLVSCAQGQSQFGRPHPARYGNIYIQRVSCSGVARGESWGPRAALSGGGTSLAKN